MDFERLSSEHVYQGRILDLDVDQIRFENGTKAVREVVQHKNAAAVVAVTDEGKLILVRQYRYAVHEDTLEIPAGLLEEGEDPMEGALRELEEETGKKAGRTKWMFRFYSSPGFCSETLDCYLCTELLPSRQHLDADEFIELVEVTSEEAMELIASRTIMDGKTIAAVSYYAALYGHADGGEAIERSDH